MLTDNPLLERLNDPLDHSVRLLADGAISQQSLTSSPEPTSNTEPSTPSAEGDEGSFDLPAGGEEGGSGEAEQSFDDVSRNSKAPDDESSRPQLEAHERTLREHLLEQVAVTVDNRRDRALVELLIDALDDNGYLEEGLDTSLERLPE